jgi:hypothetical protein
MLRGFEQVSKYRAKKLPNPSNCQPKVHSGFPRFCFPKTLPFMAKNNASILNCACEPHF